METGNISIHAQNILPIIKKWLYSEKDIFVRELTANACDAITKHKAIVAGVEGMDAETYAVTVEVDKAARQLRFVDNGIGMTAEEVKKYINQVAFSGAQEFMEKYQGAGETGIIGHFGLGFYSSFMVSEKVEILTKSYHEGEPAAHWSSEDGMAFTLEEGERAGRGTTVTLTLSENEEEYLDAYKVRSVLNTYCAFMPVPIYIKDASREEKEGDAPVPVNDTSPLWQRPAKDITEDEYKQFYKKTFGDFEDPLFWIHLAVDYPLNLKGILYFPKLRNDFALSEGQVKLYCSQVFVADNIKEIIPEFLLLLKGCIDCPDLPLNVSRSFLQNDGTVKKLSAHITKKVADKLESLFDNERERYITCWTDIAPFIKFGCIRDEKFADRMLDRILFKTTGGDSLTLSEALERVKGVSENKLVYATNPETQAVLVDAAVKQGAIVLVLDTPLDNAMLGFLEYKKPDVQFLRVDADLSDLFKREGADDASEEARAAAEKLFRDVTGEAGLEVRLMSLKEGGAPAMLSQDEQMRRFGEMSRMYGSKIADQPVKRTLTLNRSHSVIVKLLALAEGSQAASDAARQIMDLCELTVGTLSAERLTAFVARSAALLEQSIERDE